MLRPVSMLSALVATLVTTLAALALGIVVPVLDLPGLPAQTAAAADAADAPLKVTIDTLAPSVLPRKGPIRITGEITNRDDQTWTTINVYPFISDTPMTTAAELAAAAEVPVDQEVGDRITDPGPYDVIDELEPGETVSYSITLPRKRIAVGDEGGVYWFGVHALGDGPDGPAGRDSVADGRARTFLPSVPATTHAVDAALVVPVRRGVQHDSDGSITGVDGWTRALSSGGRLRSLVDFGLAAGSRPISWLVDPAVPDAVSALVAGNPARSLDATIDPTEGDGDGGDDESESASPDPTEEQSPTRDPEDEGSDEESEEDPALVAVREAGEAWLDRLAEGLDGAEVLSLPYGDVDVSAAATHSPKTYREARDRSGSEVMGSASSPVVSAPSGFLSAAAVRMIGTDTTALVGDEMIKGSDPTVVHSAGRTLVVASSAATDGGPGPESPRSMVAMRQRILGEAALRALSPERKPLVVMFSSRWSPTASTDFFAGLDVDWLHLTTVDDISHRTGRSIAADDLVYPDAQARLELGAEDFAAASDLTGSGEILQNLLTLNDQIATTVRGEALTDVSYANRKRPFLSQLSAQRSRAWIEERLRSVRVDAPKAVILSSGSGRFSATITNELDQPVTVRLKAVTSPPLEVSVPEAEVDIAAGGRSTVLLRASSSGVGVRTVTLALTDTDGSPLGSSDDLPIRSNRVSNVIWLILGTGIALLFGAIAVRLYRRVRAARHEVGGP